MPAGMLLLTSGVAFFLEASLAATFRAAGADGVCGSLRGCAEAVDVAGGAAERRDERVRKRRGWGAGDGWVREAARRQERQIIMGVYVVGGPIDELSHDFLDAWSPKVWHGGIRCCRAISPGPDVALTRIKLARVGGMVGFSTFDHTPEWHGCMNVLRHKLLYNTHMPI
jgi:hypothetical protein